VDLANRRFSAEFLCFVLRYHGSMRVGTHLGHQGLVVPLVPGAGGDVNLKAKERVWRGRGSQRIDVVWPWRR